MKIQSRRDVEACLFIGKGLLVFISGGIVFHLLVMIIDYFLMIEPFSLDIHKNYADNIFSVPMIPMMATYGLLSLCIFLLWNKAKNVALAVREKELQQEKAEAVLKSLQRFTGVLAEHIASENSKILKWIEFRKRSGHSVPARVENPSKQIAKAIQSMSELTFIRPYTVDQLPTTSEFEKIFFAKLSGTVGATEERKFSSEHRKADNES